MKKLTLISHSVQEKAIEICNWCLANDSETFSPFFEFHAHVKMLECRTYYDGYQNATSSVKSNSVYLSAEWGSDSEITRKLSALFLTIKDLKIESDIKWSPENVESQRLKIAQEGLKKAEETSARLKAEIEAMENK